MKHCFDLRLGTPQTDCSIAIADIQGPDAASLGRCGLHRHGAIAGYLDGAHYPKIACDAGNRPHSAPKPEIGSTAQATR